LAKRLQHARRHAVVLAVEIGVQQRQHAAGVGSRAQRCEAEGLRGDGLLRREALIEAGRVLLVAPQQGRPADDAQRLLLRGRLTHRATRDLVERAHVPDGLRIQAHPGRLRVALARDGRIAARSHALVERVHELGELPDARLERAVRGILRRVAEPGAHRAQARLGGVVRTGREVQLGAQVVADHALAGVADRQRSLDRLQRGLQCRALVLERGGRAGARVAIASASTERLGVVREHGEARGELVGDRAGGGRVGGGRAGGGRVACGSGRLAREISRARWLERRKRLGRQRRERSQRGLLVLRQLEDRAQELLETRPVKRPHDESPHHGEQFDWNVVLAGAGQQHDPDTPLEVSLISLVEPLNGCRLHCGPGVLGRIRALPGGLVGGVDGEQDEVAALDGAGTVRGPALATDQVPCVKIGIDASDRPQRGRKVEDRRIPRIAVGV
jgi:hypothetical protein